MTGQTALMSWLTQDSCLSFYRLSQSTASPLYALATQTAFQNRFEKLVLAEKLPAFKLEPLFWLHFKASKFHSSHTIVPWPSVPLGNFYLLNSTEAYVCIFRKGHCL
uniref:Uncharacterized protein n=1 Tax=Anguilla anguilla TaxID=7936 RepID=A0A0E9X0G2_ANGAN